MRPPDYPARGTSIKADWGRQVVDAIRAIWPVESATIKPSISSSGTSFASQGRSAPLAAAPRIFRPFELAPYFDEAGTPQVRIYASTITGAGSGLPAGFDQLGDNSWLAAAAAGTRYYHLKATSADGSYAGASIVVSASDTLDPGVGNASGLLGFATLTGTGDSLSIVVRNVAYGPAVFSVCPRPYTADEYDAWLTLSGTDGA